MRRAARVSAVLLAVAVGALFLLPAETARPTGRWLDDAGIHTRFENVAGFGLRFAVVGTGPAVVLVHGFASSMYTWRAVVPALAKTHSVVLLDLPGFGASDQPADVSAEVYPAVLLGLLDRLGLERASFVGNSLGGGVVAVVAVTHPERVERVVLIDSVGFNLAPSDRPWLLRLVGAGPLAPILERVPLRRRLIRMALGQVFFDRSKVNDDEVEEYVAPILRKGAVASLRSVLTTRTEALGRVLPGRLGEVRAPTLIVWGREDGWIPVAQADRFAAAIQGARKEVIEGCGHMPQEERPEEVLRLIEPFLAAAGG